MNPKTIIWTILVLLPIHIFAQNKALDFDGTNDYVNLGNPSQLSFPGTAPFTFSAWVKLSSTSSNRNILSKYNGGVLGHYNFSIGSGRVFALREVPPYSVTGSTVLQVNTWYHVATVYDGTDLKVFVNGVEDGSTNIPGSIGNTSTDVYVGASQSSNSPSDFMEGIIDELRVWNVARTANQLQNDMNQEISCATTGLVACYHFNQGIAGGNNSGVTTLEDGTSNNLDGSLINFALMGNTSNWVDGAPALPVEFINFDARMHNEKVILKWITSSEVNNRGFRIERSKDGRTWKHIGFVGGKGMSNDYQYYSFTDLNPFYSINYYRLKQMDYDGNFTYSKIVTAIVESIANQFSFFPNPTSGNIHLKLNKNREMPINLELHNSIGQRVYGYKLIDEKGELFELDLSDKGLEQGWYLLSLHTSLNSYYEKLLITNP